MLTVIALCFVGLCLVLLIYIVVSEALSEWFFGKPLLDAGGNDLGSGAEAFLLLWPVWVPLVLLVIAMGIYAIVARISTTASDWIDQKIPGKNRKKADCPVAASAQQPVPVGPRAGVGVRMPRDADDFESVAAEWLQACGVQARRTPKGPDGGLDLRGGGYAGQCKFHPSRKIGGPEIQQLVGAAQGYGTPVFFHYGPGYTEAAIKEARRLGVSLWQLDPKNKTFQHIR